jgi:hypothetical protein
LKRHHVRQSGRIVAHRAVRPAAVRVEGLKGPRGPLVAGPSGPPLEEPGMAARAGRRQIPSHRRCQPMALPGGLPIASLGR